MEIPSVKQSSASFVLSNGKSEHSTKGTLPIKGWRLAIAYSFLHNSFSSISHSWRHILRNLRFSQSFFTNDWSPWLCFIIFLVGTLPSLSRGNSARCVNWALLFCSKPWGRVISSVLSSLSVLSDGSLVLRRLKSCVLASEFLGFRPLGGSRQIGNAE